MARRVTKKAAKPAAETTQPPTAPAPSEPATAKNTLPTTETPAAAARKIKVRFLLLDLGAKQVALTGDFNGWSAEATPMTRRENGYWGAEVELLPGRYEYKFVVDGQWVPDPLARENVWNYHGTLNSVIEVPA